MLGLLGAFRSLVDAAHLLLDERGHLDARPAFGFALQAVGAGASASEVALRLGVSKQAAAKTVATLEAAGYVSRQADPDDARRKLVVPTARGRGLLADSAAAFEDVVAGWAERIGADGVAELHDLLRRLDARASAKLDLGSWSS